MTLGFISRMPFRPYILAEAPWKFVSGAAYDVAVLPWGATEAHNYHLPYGTDNIESDHVAAESARIAWERGARVVVLPTVPFGVNTTQLDIPFCLNMNPSTQAALLADLASALEGQGVRKLVIVNSHGGNDFKQMIRELQPKTRVLLVTINWWAVVDQKRYFDDLGDHAGEMETSVLLHVVPDLVQPLGDAGSGRERKPKIAGLRERWAWTPRRWTQVTSDTGIGDPKAATAEKGERFLRDVTERIGGFLVDLAAADPEDLYE
jgi:creatinine amidohydrolase